MEDTLSGACMKSGLRRFRCHWLLHAEECKLRLRLRLMAGHLRSCMVLRRWSSTLQEQLNYHLFEKHTSFVIADVKMVEGV